MHQTNPTSKLRDVANAAQASLSFQRTAVEIFHQRPSHNKSGTVPNASAPREHTTSPAPSATFIPGLPAKALQDKSHKRINVVISDEETDIEGMSENDHRQPCSMVHRFSFWFYLTLTAGNRQRVSLGNPDDKDEDRNLLDVEVQEIDVVSLSRMQKH